ncbi:winged helix-turn-helix domain-containing protein [Methanobrevibacter sp. TMH8]|uniref:winged helix-turn-helix domain-containing protein n=1 Tax=Methanobrevibacter sp. TMH8 TaxID=2848611 RepID=UPI001CCB388E|nr:winged helix-turn-helix domain-containing protein [Methanobrevibacter sp. TMH8]MBZ9570943.1 winged helix-turn-helix domain-containing protein [Methanobrevibacter sp. TMH8]
MEVETAEKIGWVKLSEHRKKIMLDLSNTLKIPTEISKSTELSKSEVSRTLRALKDAGIVVCHNEDSHRGRLYGLTDEGNEIIKYIH